MGLKKTRELISVFPALFSACIDRLDVVPANPSQYQYHLPGGIAYFFFWPTKRSRVHYKYSRNHWKHWIMSFNKNDLSGSSIVLNIWKHWITTFQQDVSCVSHWWGLLLLHSVDYIRYLSITKYHPEIPDYVNNNVSGTSQLPRTTRYQVLYQEGKEKGNEGKKKAKENEKWIKNKYALR